MILRFNRISCEVGKDSLQLRFRKYKFETNFKHYPTSTKYCDPVFFCKLAIFLAGFFRMFTINEMVYYVAILLWMCEYKVRIINCSTVMSSKLHTMRKSYYISCH